MVKKSFRAACLLGGLAAASGCNAILGIHDLSDGGGADSEGSGGNGGAGGGGGSTVGGAGGSGGAGAGGVAGNGGAGGGDGSTLGGTGGSGGTGAGSGGAGGSGGSGGSAGGSGGSGGQGGSGDAGAACPSGLQDKITTCTAGMTPACVEGCGPDLPAGSSQPNLGTKTCTCNTAGVYTCADCTYEATIAACYVPATTPPACPAGVANEVACTAACSPSTASPPGPCTFTTDAGKLDGCVCVMESTTAAGPVWSCATEWW
jgi:hypothetical protein